MHRHGCVGEDAIPIGAQAVTCAGGMGSGAFLATKAVYELHRTGGRYALVTMCIGGGQGIAAVFERL